MIAQIVGWRACVGLALGLLHLGMAAAEVGLTLRTNDVIGLVGGSVWVAEQRDGYLEAALRQTHPGHQLRVRNFGWEGDTVASGLREVNYPHVPALMRRYAVTVALLQFGQSESFAGDAGLAAFRRDYAQLLDQLGAITPRLVLVTPLPFESPPPPIPDLASRNSQLASYVGVVRELGAARGLPVLDLFTNASPAPGLSLTTDGRQLSVRGEAVSAREIVRAWAPTLVPASDPVAWLTGPQVEPLRVAVVAKNQLWRYHVRPTNWAFLAGDRTEQASSRDHRDRNVRWFPGEVEEFGRRLSDAERKLDQLLPENR